MNSDTLFDTIVGGALGGGGVFLLKEAASWYVKRALTARHLAQDAVIDLALTLRAIESVFEKACKQDEPKGQAALIQYPSHWLLRPMVLDVKTLLGAFQDARLNRELIVFADRFEAFREESEGHLSAFQVLLPLSDWTSTPAQEALGRLNYHRGRVQRVTRDMLCHGYAAMARLLRVSKSHPQLAAIASLLAYDEGQPVAEVLAEQYGMEEETMPPRAAFYAIGETVARFDGGVRWGCLTWVPSRATSRASLRAKLKLHLKLPAKIPANFPSTVSLRPRIAVALPEGTSIAKCDLVFEDKTLPVLITPSKPVSHDERRMVIIEESAEVNRLLGVDH